MEIIVGVVCAGLLGYVIDELKELRRSFNKLENRIISIEFLLPKRETDKVVNNPSQEIL